MWIRKCYKDESRELHSPVPTEIVSNEEFVPLGQTVEQRRAEEIMFEDARRHARRLGVDRRTFMQSAAGVFCGLLAMNKVFGRTWDVSEAMVYDSEMLYERWPKDQFIFDVQTHHIDLEGSWYRGTEAGKAAADFLKRFRRSRVGAGQEGKIKIAGLSDADADALAQMNQDFYIKELFLDSDTVMTCMSGAPVPTHAENFLPPKKMVDTRNRVNQIAGSRRMVSHGLLSPQFERTKVFEDMEWQAKELKIDAWKMYPGAPERIPGWALDDERIAYPCWEKTRKLGIKNLCVHKGLPLGFFTEEYCHPKDVEKAARDFPDLNFIIYHSALHLGPLMAREGREKAAAEPQWIPWCSDLFAIRKRNPKLTNIYLELGSTFAQLHLNPKMLTHFFGQALALFGADHILWGTDCLWSGSPQPVITSLRTFKMDAEIASKYRYPDLTDADKNLIFGLNAARLYGIDPKARRKALRYDHVAELKREYEVDPRPESTAYGWVWVDDAEGRRIMAGVKG